MWMTGAKTIVQSQLVLYLGMTCNSTYAAFRNGWELDAAMGLTPFLVQSLSPPFMGLLRTSPDPGHYPAYHHQAEPGQEAYDAWGHQQSAAVLLTPSEHLAGGRTGSTCVLPSLGGSDSETSAAQKKEWRKWGR
jgi:hypothetical protein